MSNSERKATLALWLEENGVCKQKLADAMGVSRVFVATALERDSMPEKRHKQFVALGIPEHLLPPVFIGPFGRPPKRGEYNTNIIAV